MKIIKTETIEAEQPVSKALNVLLKTGLPVIITKNNEYWGIIDDRHLRLADPAKTKCQSVAIRAPTISPDDSVPMIARLFLAGHFKGLPVVKENEILGILPRLEFLEYAMEEGFLRGLKAKDVMVSPVYSITPDTPLGEARRKMKELRVHRLVVMEGRKIEGIITTFDLAIIFFMRDTKPSLVLPSSYEKIMKKPVKEFLREKVVTASPEDALSRIVELMKENNITSVVILNDRTGVPEGVVVVRDILKLLAKEDIKIDVVVTGDEEGKIWGWDIANIIVQRLGRRGILKKVEIVAHAHKRAELSVKLEFTDGTVHRIGVEKVAIKEATKEFKERLKRLVSE